MAALNRAAMIASAASLGQFETSSTAATTRLQQLLHTAEGILWGAADWIFKKVGQTAITYPTTGIVTLPADFGSSILLMDDQGDALNALDPVEFDRIYQSAIVNAQRAQRPEAYKVVNRAAQVAPLPVGSIGGFMSYTRRQSHFASDGVTVVGGEMTIDTDLPLWPSPHHMVLVWCLLTLSGVADADVAAVMWDQSYESALQAMIDELTGADVGAAPKQYGRDPL